MEQEITKYTNFGINDIDNYIKIGEQLSLQISEEKKHRELFAMYCRNYCNFLINNTKFNYLLEMYSYVNEQIISDYDNNYKYVKLIIQINNELLRMINLNANQDTNLKQNNFDLSFINNYIKSDDSNNNIWEPISNYINCIMNINIDTLDIFIVGTNDIRRIYVDIKVLEDRIKKMEPNENKAYLYDLYKYYYCISYRLIQYTNKINDDDQMNKINKILNLFKKTVPSSKIEAINKSILYYLDYMKNINELKVFIPNENKKFIPNENKKFIPNENKKLKKPIIDDISLPLMALGAVTIMAGILVKITN